MGSYVHGVEPHSAACKHCGHGEYRHLNHRAKKPDGTACHTYEPVGGITREQGHSMHAGLADYLANRKNNKKKPPG